MSKVASNIHLLLLPQRLYVLQLENGRQYCNKVLNSLREMWLELKMVDVFGWLQREGVRFVQFTVSTILELKEVLTNPC